MNKSFSEDKPNRAHRIAENIMSIGKQMTQYKHYVKIKWKKMDSCATQIISQTI